jgi:glycosyltransferase involved in cell wall biosynthesis
MSAHILIIADGRSPTARSWLANIQALGYDVSLVSTFPCDPPEGLRHFSILPVALSRFSSDTTSSAQPASDRTPPAGARALIRRFAPLFQSLRYYLGPLSFLKFAPVYKRLLREIKPDLVHALRIPFEGMLGSYTPEGIPFLVSTWGNDLTLHAAGSLFMRAFTKRCLARANGFMADTHRDSRLAQVWGLAETVPTLVVPGAGGLDVEAIFHAQGFDPAAFEIPTQGDWVVNPRGLRPGSVHQEVFFAAIPDVLTDHPETRFICPGLARNSQVQGWVEKFGIQQNIHLLPKLSQTLLWSLYQQAQLYVSPSSHDGSPNSLLEAMACGCFPVVGDIESLQEWIENGTNGLLVNPTSEKDLAAAICHALGTEDLRQNAARHNLAMIRERAAKNITRPRIDAFYRQFIT